MLISTWCSFVFLKLLLLLVDFFEFKCLDLEIVFWFSLFGRHLWNWNSKFWSFLLIKHFIGLFGVWGIKSRELETVVWIIRMNLKSFLWFSSILILRISFLFIWSDLRRLTNRVWKYMLSRAVLKTWALNQFNFFMKRVNL